jgi:predicted ATPase
VVYEQRYQGWAAFMITKWKLFNFKSVRQETALDFERLTIFAGPNSSGKSTCIQSILLICQTLRNQIRSRSVVLNGSMTRLGQFSDLKSTQSVANQVLIGWELRPISSDRLQAVDYEEDWVTLLDGSLVSAACDVAFDARLDSQNDSTQLNPRLFSTVIRGSIRDSEGVDHSIRFGLSRAADGGAGELQKLQSLGVSGDELDGVRSAIDVQLDMDEASQQHLKTQFVSGQPVGCELLHFLPQRVALVYNLAEEQIKTSTSAFFGLARTPSRLRSRSRDFPVPIGALRVLKKIWGTAGSQIEENNADTLLSGNRPVLFSALLDAIRNVSPSRRRQAQELLHNNPQFADEFSTAMRSELRDEYRTAFSVLSQEVRASCNFMRNYFSQAVKYLGPLRDEPKALYPLASGSDPFDIGLQGENMAAVLDLHKGRLIQFIAPTEVTRRDVTPQSAKRIFRTLQSAVTEWLRYLGVAEDVESIDKGKLGHELKVKIDRSSGDQDLTHVGVGVSQVLPILVMSLLAENDSVLLFEQPELHLHPRVQTLLGDFFISMAFLDKQCVIETHSEYLINRLRFRAAAAESADIADRIKIYFVEKRDDCSTFRPVVVNEFGAIPDWPEGFFDQSQDEAEQIIRAATQKRQSRKGGAPSAGSDN